MCYNMKYVLEKCSRSCSLKTCVVVVAIIITLQYLVNLSIYKASQVGTKYTYWSVLRNLSGIYEPMVTTTQTPLNLSVCPIIPPGLQGRLTVNIQIPAWAFIEEENPLLMAGGRYKPRDCSSRNRVAIVIPYRDREIHLKLFLQNLHPFLQRQQLDYGIYVVEMADGIQFNRALLMNVGFNEAIKEYDYQCFIFHDVDLLPEDDRNLYTCPHMPRHMSTAIDKLKYTLPYAQIFGGVSAISTDHFRLINGFSNIYFGWGGEDDDMYKRILYSNLTVTRYSNKVARYKMLVHKHSKANPERFKLLKTAKLRQDSDGLTSLRYKVLRLEKKPLYTWILVSVNMTAILVSEPFHKYTAQSLKKAAPNIQTPETNEMANQSLVSQIGQNSNVNKNQHSTRPIIPNDQIRINMNKSPKVVDWVPEDYKGDLPENLTKFQPAMFVVEPVPKRAVPQKNSKPIIINYSKSGSKSRVNSNGQRVIGQNVVQHQPISGNQLVNIHHQQQQQQYLQQRKRQLQQRQAAMAVQKSQGQTIHGLVGAVN